MESRRWLLALVLLGLGLRAYHYLRDREVWQDEAGLLLTVTARGYGELFCGHLDYHQAAPPLYLCALKTVGLVLGDGSRALRLPSFLAGCAALLLLVAVARRILPARAVPWAVLLFAVSEQLLWHASEAKAYSVDVLAAVVILAIPCWRRGPASQLAAYALLAPLLLLSSYPACFLCAALLLVYLPTVYTAKQLRPWLGYAALAAATGAVLLWLVFGPVRRQHDAEIHSCWVACFPDWGRPWTVPGWLLLSPFEIGRYCCKPLGQLLALLAVPGAVVLWRRGERTAVGMMLAPLALALAAACLHRYPFGGARVMVFAAPAVVLLGAAGVPPVTDWVHARCRPAAAALLALLLVPAVSSLGLAVRTWQEADVRPAADFVRGRRLSGDFIIGNDVAQQYYFRGLGPAFHLLDESPLPAPPGDRLWVVMTAALPHAERARMAGQLAPAGWRLARRQEYALTTVFLFRR